MAYKREAVEKAAEIRDSYEEQIEDHAPPLADLDRHLPIPASLLDYTGKPSGEKFTFLTFVPGLHSLECTICNALFLQPTKYKAVKLRVFAYWRWRIERGLGWTATNAQDCVRANTTMVSALFRIWEYCGLFRPVGALGSGAITEAGTVSGSGSGSGTRGAMEIDTTPLRLRKHTKSRKQSNTTTNPDETQSSPRSKSRSPPPIQAAPAGSSSTTVPRTERSTSAAIAVPRASSSFSPTSTLTSRSGGTPAHPYPRPLRPSYSSQTSSSDFTSTTMPTPSSFPPSSVQSLIGPTARRTRGSWHHRASFPRPHAHRYPHSHSRNTPSDTEDPETMEQSYAYGLSSSSSGVPSSSLAVLNTLCAHYSSSVPSSVPASGVSYEDLRYSDTSLPISTSPSPPGPSTRSASTATATGGTGTGTGLTGNVADHWRTVLGNPSFPPILPRSGSSYDLLIPPRNQAYQMQLDDQLDDQLVYQHNQAERERRLSDSVSSLASASLASISGASGSNGGTGAAGMERSSRSLSGSGSEGEFPMSDARNSPLSSPVDSR